MCCLTNSFCCTHDLRKGITIAGIIDIILLLIIIVLNISFQRNYLSLWFLVVIIADILLVIGANGNKSSLLMFWLIIEMINIVFLFIGWIGIPIYRFVTVFATDFCNTTKIIFNCEGAEDFVVAEFVIDLVFIIGLPIYYIYLWVVVKSHRENLTRAERNTIQPLQGKKVLNSISYRS